ncbi:DUF3606 domain-containing protein [Mesorhizobium sp. C432A]|nr:hypothetical protein [Mesorhizobium sp. C432A]WJI55968.1 DUF3606 domain-containing protein [Mesorhizobium sp. C432A]
MFWAGGEGRRRDATACADLTPAFDNPPALASWSFRLLAAALARLDQPPRSAVSEVLLQRAVRADELRLKEKMMTDNKSERDFGDRNRVSSNERNEHFHFAQQNGITPEQAMEFIIAAGNDRASLRLRRN